MNKNQKQVRRTFKGTVVSDKSDKTVVVQIDRVVVHPKYGKRYTKSKKLHAHDPNNLYKEGEIVTIVQCRPISKKKCWRVLKKAAKNNAPLVEIEVDEAKADETESI